MILSVIWNSNHLGAAYYNIVTSELFVMEDTMDDVERLDKMKALYRQCLPRYVVTSAAAPAAFTNAVKRILTSQVSSNGETNSCNAQLKVTCRKEHNYERCAHRVKCLRLESEPKNASNADRRTFLNSILNFKCCAMIHALGSLLFFVDKHWNNIALDPSGKPSFVSLNYIWL
ncbi:MutS protein like protein 5 [Habropoda laboriosa]|uniref:MutS protein like protein 5 n=1 Tax=Habropoda laboriosa TaxID=597456 RepID=A0A0L7QXI2_9HYME|nr:MutS protein like protein 5 [Habropoda laboriosa]